ncbi:Uncharacterised protein [Streptococcus pneumoniae]|nr:Uncharacterised protein [Streptococcus pneumoniae]
MSVNTPSAIFITSTFGFICSTSMPTGADFVKATTTHSPECETDNCGIPSGNCGLPCCTLHTEHIRSIGTWTGDIESILPRTNLLITQPIIKRARSAE